MLQDVAAGTPFEAAPLLSVEFLAEENGDEVGIVVVEGGEVEVEVGAVELSGVPAVVEDLVVAEVGGQDGGDVFDPRAVLSGEG